MRASRSRSVIRAVGLLLTIPLLVQCASVQTRTLTMPEDLPRPVPKQAPGQLTGPRAEHLKVHFRDGRMWRLSDWRFDEQSRKISGVGDLLDADRTVRRSGSFEAPLDSVALFEANSTVTSPGVSVLTVITIGSLAVTAYCAANPKACFGSCPTFYASDGTADRLMAEGFSASVAPILEATDLDALYQVRPQGDRLNLRVTNEALETHVIRHADLLVLPRPPAGRVFATAERSFFAATEPVPASRVLDPAGTNPTLLARLDGRERFVPADSANLAAKEELVLVYPAPQGENLGLVVSFRQSLLTTFLFYQTLAYLGGTAGEWLARLERSDPDLAQQVAEPGRLLGGIAVAVERDGHWIEAGEIRETGPLASDVRLLPLPPSSVEGDSVRVRLRLTQGAWRIDWVGLTNLLGPVEPVRVTPEEVFRDGRPVSEVQEALRERSEPLVTLPGDAYELSYLLPRFAGEREIFLESRGYYLEWMRPQWIEEENPLLAARMLMDPERSLRELAPSYKAKEAEMERIFWSSRYVRR